MEWAQARFPRETLHVPFSRPTKMIESVVGKLAEAFKDDFTIE